MGVLGHADHRILKTNIKLIEKELSGSRGAEDPGMYAGEKNKIIQIETILRLETGSRRIGYRKGVKHRGMPRAPKPWAFIFAWFMIIIIVIMVTRQPVFVMHRGEDFIRRFHGGSQNRPTNHPCKSRKQYNRQKALRYHTEPSPLNLLLHSCKSSKTKPSPRE